MKHWLDTAIGVLVGVILAGVALWVASPPRGEPITLEPPPPSPTPAPLVVHVGGAVVFPGVYSLPKGSRVKDAIAAAGGFAPDADPDALNLAAYLGDGMRIYVPSRFTPTPPDFTWIATSPPPTASPSPVLLLDLNSATAQELEKLPHVGATIAQRIVKYRQTHGPFHRVEDLLKVKGIGPSLLKKIRPYVTISGIKR